MTKINITLEDVSVTRIKREMCHCESTLPLVRTGVINVQVQQCPTAVLTTRLG